MSNENKALIRRYAEECIGKGDLSLLDDLLAPNYVLHLNADTFDLQGYKQFQPSVLGAFPDPYYALRPRWKWYGDSDPVRVARLMRVRRHIPRIRLIFFGIKPKYRRLGVDAVLYDEVKQYAMKQGYQTCDISMLLEDNYLILRASSFMDAERYKTWRIYDLPL